MNRTTKYTKSNLITAMDSPAADPDSQPHHRNQQSKLENNEHDEYDGSDQDSESDSDQPLLQTDFWWGLEELLVSKLDPREEPELVHRAQLALLLRREVPWLRTRAFVDPQLGPPLHDFAAEALGWPRDEGWSLVGDHPVWLARLCYHGFLSIMTPLAENFFLLTPKLHRQRCLLHFSSLHVPKKVKKGAKRYCLRVNTHPELVVQQVTRFHSKSNWVYPPLQRAFRLLFAASRIMDADAAAEEEPERGKIHAGDGPQAPKQEQQQQPPPPSRRSPPQALSGPDAASSDVPEPLALRLAALMKSRADTRSFRLHMVGIWRDLAPEELSRCRAEQEEQQLQPGRGHNQGQERPQDMPSSQHPDERRLQRGQQQQQPRQQVALPPPLEWLKKGLVVQREDKKRRRGRGEANAADANPVDVDEGQRNNEQLKELAMRSLAPQLIDWERGSVLCGGEIGYSVGTVYTSLTGFTSCDGAGTIQMVALGKLLERQGFSFWDLGMGMAYKHRLGGEDTPREVFVGMLQSVRDSPAPQLSTDESCLQLVRP